MPLGGEAIGVDPGREGFERGRVEVARPALTIPGTGDQPGGLQHLDVPGDGLLGDRKRLCQLVDRCRTTRKSGDELSPHRVRDILEVIVTTTGAPRYSAFAKRHYAEGEAEGEVKGERHTIRMVLKARGLALTEDQAEQIEACDNLDILKKWSEAALTAEVTDEIFR